MFAIKFHYETDSNLRERVVSAAEYSRMGRTLTYWPPLLSAAYPLRGDVCEEVDLDDPELIEVFFMNSTGRTIDRLSGPAGISG